MSLVSHLDLSAASGTIDQSILLSRLSYSLVISGTVLACIASYLSDRIQISPCCTSIRRSQEYVLGLILFVLYTQPLSKIIQHHSLYHQSVSDDNQLYISPNLSQLQEIIRVRNRAYLMFRHGCTTINFN